MSSATFVEILVGNASLSTQGKKAVRYWRATLADDDDPRTDSGEIVHDFSAWSGIVHGSPYVTPTGFYDDDMTVTGINATRQSEDGWDYQVQVTYSTPSDSTSGGSDWTNPLYEPSVWSYDFNDRDIPIDFDYFGNPLVNSCGMPFLKPVMATISDLIVTVVKNEALFNVTFATAYAGAINSDYFWGLPPGCVKFKPGNCTSQYDSVIGTYMRNTYIFHCRRDTFAEYVLDQGFQYLGTDPATGETKPYCIMTNGAPSPEPRLLDGAGNVIPGGSTNFYYWEVWKNPILPFNAAFYNLAV